jgi:hypothetical protein
VDLIGIKELKEKLDRGDDFKLVMVLGEWEYRAKHIPGSVRVSTIDEGLETLDYEDEIVLYDTGPPLHRKPDGLPDLEGSRLRARAATLVGWRSGKASAIRWKVNTSDNHRMTMAPAARCQSN